MELFQCKLQTLFGFQSSLFNIIWNIEKSHYIKYNLFGYIHTLLCLRGRYWEIGIRIVSVWCSLLSTNNLDLFVGLCVISI